MHSGIAATVAVAVVFTGVAVRDCDSGVVLLLVLFSLSGAVALRVGKLMLQVRLGPVHPRFVHADFELTGPRYVHVAAAVVVLEECVQVVALIVLSTTRRFD